MNLPDALATIVKAEANRYAKEIAHGGTIPKTPELLALKIAYAGIHMAQFLYAHLAKEEGEIPVSYYWAPYGMETAHEVKASNSRTQYIPLAEAITFRAAYIKVADDLAMRLMKSSDSRFQLAQDLAKSNEQFAALFTEKARVCADLESEKSLRQAAEKRVGEAERELQTYNKGHADTIRGLGNELMVERDKKADAWELLTMHIRRLHGQKALECEHDYEPDTCLTELRCDKCGVDANLGAARKALEDAE